MLIRKLTSLHKYFLTFENWITAAMIRYKRAVPGVQVTLKCRDGRRLLLEPAKDRVAMGEIFAAESYAPILNQKNVHIIWDVGGNIGCFAVWAAKHFPDANFHSFEPAPDAFTRLTINQKQNPHIKWKIEPFGFSSLDETCTAYVQDNSGETSRYCEHGNPIIFTLKDISAYWNAQGRPQIDILKIDCEGGEYDILLNSSDEFFLSAKCIAIEVHSVANFSPESIRKRLKKTGFHVSWAKEIPGMAYAFRNS